MTLEELSIIYTADVSGAMDAIRILGDAVQQSGREAEEMETLFSQAGLQAAQGLANGIQSGQSQVMAAARQVAQAASNALRAALEIHSPSKVTQEMGQQFHQGLINGILMGTGAVENAVNTMTPSFAHLQSGADMLPVPGQEKGDIHLTIPIELDGYQLGLAAIDSINRVSRLSGKSEITI